VAQVRWEGFYIFLYLSGNFPELSDKLSQLMTVGKKSYSGKYYAFLVERQTIFLMLPVAVILTLS
jgi:hypothetical protein